MKLSAQYSPRPIRFLDLWEMDGWKLKAYTISYGAKRVAAELISAAHGITRERLQASGEATAHYGVGFVGIHQGKTGDFIFVDWWAEENELHHHVYVSPCAQPEALEYKTPTGLAACTWDLALVGHERDAWVKHVLKGDAAPDLAGYLLDRMQADV